MRDNIWYSLVDAKFKAIFLNECSRTASFIGQGYTIFLAIVASTSVGAWVVWSKYPAIWAIIVAVSQLLHVIKPHIPFLKQGGIYRDMSNMFESLYLQYEKIWYKLQQSSMDYKKVEKDFYNLRKEELEIETKYAVHPPRFQWLMRKSRKELDNTLYRFFKGENNV